MPMRALLAAAFLVLIAAPAAASAIFPPGIDDHLSLGYEPVCTLCHQTLAGGFGTATQPFGEKMRSRGLVAGDVTSLNNALDALTFETPASDVDGDGVGDIQELRDGTDPNTAAGTLEDPPEYGCLGNVAPVPSGRAGAALVLAALTLVATRRRPST